MVFSLDQLRQTQMSLKLKYQVQQLKKLHSKIDDEFLNNRIEARNIVIIN